MDISYIPIITKLYMSFEYKYGDVYILNQIYNYSNGTSTDFKFSNEKYKRYQSPTQDKILLWEKGDNIYETDILPTSTKNMPNSLILFKSEPTQQTINEIKKPRTICPLTTDINTFIETSSDISFNFWLENDSDSNLYYINTIATKYGEGASPSIPTNGSIELADTNTENGLNFKINFKVPKKIQEIENNPNSTGLLEEAKIEYALVSEEDYALLESSSDTPTTWYNFEKIQYGNTYISLTNGVLSETNNLKDLFTVDKGISFNVYTKNDYFNATHNNNDTIFEDKYLFVRISYKNNLTDNFGQYHNFNKSIKNIPDESKFYIIRIDRIDQYFRIDIAYDEKKYLLDEIDISLNINNSTVTTHPKNISITEMSFVIQYTDIKDTNSNIKFDFRIKNKTSSEYSLF